MTSCCAYCDHEVRPRQQALQCDRCMRWQHRTCQSGISLVDYRQMVKGALDVEWYCCVCKHVEPESPLSSDSDTPNRPPPAIIVPDTPVRRSIQLQTPPQSPSRTVVPQTPSSPQFELLPSLPRPIPAPRRIQLPASPQTPPQMEPPQSPPPRPIPAPRRPRPVSPQRPVPAPRRLMTASNYIEDALQDGLHNMSIEDHDELRFEILPKASRSNKDLLVDNRGYTYNLKRNVPNGRDWQCAIRQKSLYCSATVKQRGDTFTFGTHQHCHEGAPSVATSKRITAKVKEDSLNNVFVSAGTIAERVLFSMSDVDLPPPSRPNLSNLIRIANRTREKLRPKEPKDCSFEIATGFIPEGFLRSDIRHDGQRHLLFGTDEQLIQLADVQTWYIDGTFKVAKDPFVQLFSIHGFLGDDQKQVPLAFALMTRRQTSDYIKVFGTLLDILPRRASVQTIFADFEKAAWAAARQTLPGVTVQGCHFHWSQAVWRHVQEAGLQVRYNEDRQTYEIVRQLLALPFVPTTAVVECFQDIQASVDNNDDRLTSLMDYVNRTWMESTTFPPASWNVFRKTTRTNNDC